MAEVTPSTEIDGVVIVEPTLWKDPRGFFAETFRQEWLPEGSPTMVQGNRADRQANTMVGLHYHRFQADYWYVPIGAARVVLHDLRTGSPTDGATLTLDLGARADGTHDHRGVFIPPGVAHGFSALSDMTITYLVDGYYNPDDELGVAWDDPEIAADWGVAEPTLSGRDQKNPRRADIAPQWQPHYGLRP